MEGIVDLAIIGAGPAGATLASCIARAGHSVVLLERECGPRYRVGESLLPATVQYIAPLLGIAEDLAASGYAVKRGATFSWGDRPEVSWTLPFGPTGDLAGDPRLSAFNVSRREFDELFITSAARAGTKVLRGADVYHVGGVNDVGLRPVTYSRTGSEAGEKQLQARFVANATGQMRLPVPGLEARHMSVFFRKAAVWGYWQGAGRLEAPLEGNVFFETTRTVHGDAWLWFIPINDSITSIGIVAPRDCLPDIRRNPEATFASLLEGCPRTKALIGAGTRISNPPYDNVRYCADYSYASEAFWAPGLFNVGDAACFVDVLLSSGVHLATYGALLAARSVNAVLSGKIPEAHAMNEYESRLRQEYAVFYAGLMGLYDMTKSGEHYGRWLRGLLQNSNGVRLEWQEDGVTPSGLNSSAADPSLGHPADRVAEQNAETMRKFVIGLLADDGPPRTLDPASLPALRNTLVPSRNGLSWSTRQPAAVPQAG